jgi:hypothetical protein
MHSLTKEKTGKWHFPSIHDLTWLFYFVSPVIGWLSFSEDNTGTIARVVCAARAFILHSKCNYYFLCAAKLLIIFIQLNIQST